MNAIITSPARNYNASVSASGVPLAVHYREDGRPFVAGVPGARYVISVRNMTTRKLLVCASVDGRSVLDDAEANWGTNRGIILKPRELYRFMGFRLNDDETGSFVFGNPQDSVSAQALGHTGQTGVIGLAGFSEPAPPVYTQYRGSNVVTRDSIPRSWPGGQSVTTSMAPVASAGAVPVASAGPVDYDLGTQMGEVQEDKVVKAHFDRTGITPDVIVIGYATYESLKQAGIFSSPVPGDREPFPGSSTETGYRQYLPR